MDELREIPEHLLCFSSDALIVIDDSARIQPTTIVLRTNRTLFCQLQQNLLGNAIEYTDRGWGRLECVEESDGVVIHQGIRGALTRISPYPHAD